MWSARGSRDCSARSAPPASPAPRNGRGDRSPGGRAVRGGAGADRRAGRTRCPRAARGGRAGRQPARPPRPPSQGHPDQGGRGARPGPPLPGLPRRRGRAARSRLRGGRGAPAPGGLLRRLPVLEPGPSSWPSSGPSSRPARRWTAVEVENLTSREGAAAAPDPAAAPRVGGGRGPGRAGAGPPDRGRGRRGRGGRLQRRRGAVRLPRPLPGLRDRAGRFGRPRRRGCWPAGPAASASTSGWPAAGSTAPSCTWSRCRCWPTPAGSAWPSGREPAYEPGPAAVRGAAARAGAGPGCRP